MVSFSNRFGGSNLSHQNYQPHVKNQQNQQQVRFNNPVLDIFDDTYLDIESAVMSKSVVSPKENILVNTRPTFESITDTINAMPLLTDKKQRIQQYRQMAALMECDWCIDEIANDFLHYDENNDFIKMNIAENLPALNDTRREILDNEFKKFISKFNFPDESYNYLRRFIIEGELAFENVINSKYPQLGIIAVRPLQTEFYETLIDLHTYKPIGIAFNMKEWGENINRILSLSYYNSTTIFNNMINVSPGAFNPNDCIPLLWPQLTYINSGNVSPDGIITFPFLEKCKQAYYQLVLLQDAAVILRVTRAPERLLFNISTGGMPDKYAEEYVRRFGQSLKAKKTIQSRDFGANLQPGGQKDIASVYNPVTMLESYIFGKSNANDGTTVESVTSTADYDQMGDINYFLRRLLKQFKIPWARYETPENTIERNDTISSEEYSFAQLIMRFQRRFAQGLKASFITHLKLRQLWNEYNLKDQDIEINFTPPALYDIYQRQKLAEAKVNTYTLLADREEFSKIYAMKKLLNMDDADIDENFKLMAKEKQYMALAETAGGMINDENLPEDFKSPLNITKVIKDEDEESESGEEGSEEESFGGEEEPSEEGELPDLGGPEGGPEPEFGDSSELFGLG